MVLTLCVISSCITHISSLYHSSPIYYTSCLHYYNCTIDTILCMHCFGFCKELMPKSVNMSFRKGKGPKEQPSKALPLRKLRWISICTWWTVPPVLDRKKEHSKSDAVVQWCHFKLEQSQIVHLLVCTWSWLLSQWFSALVVGGKN